MYVIMVLYLRTDINNSTRCKNDGVLVHAIKA
jgi:hypothetical protein